LTSWQALTYVDAMTALPTGMAADQAFGRAVHQAMWDRHITQKVMAPAIGLDQSTLSKKLRGIRPWSFKELLDVADFLKMDARDLLASMWGPGDGPNPIGGKSTVGKLAPNLKVVRGEADTTSRRTGHLTLLANAS